MEHTEQHCPSCRAGRDPSGHVSGGAAQPTIWNTIHTNSNIDRTSYNNTHIGLAILTAQASKPPEVHVLKK